MKKLYATFVAILVVFSATGAVAIPVGAQSADPFSDVSNTSLNYDAINYLKTNNIIQGYSDGTYKPGNEINRAEFTKIVIGALTNKSLQGKNCFSDVGEDWYAPYVCEAKTRGLISGYEDGSFKPAKNINFAEASKIVANALAGGPATASVNSADQWFKPYVTQLQSKNDIPLSVSFFDENLTRAEMAEMIYRLKAGIADKASRTYDEIAGNGFVTVNSCAALKARFDEAQPEIYYEKGGGAMPDAVVSFPPSVAGAVSETKTSDGSAADFSTTNVQVQGVDEGDVIKNDGKYIYIIHNGTLRIVEAYPASNMKELVNIILGEGSETFSPQQLYVDGDKMVVIGSKFSQVVYDTTALKSSIYPYWGSNRTKVYVLDIADRAKPVVTRAVEFDGDYSDSRRIGETMYLVLNKTIYHPYPYYAVEDSVALSSTEEQVQEDPSSIVPRMFDSAKGVEEYVAPCSEIKILPKNRAFSYVITAAIPLADAKKNVSRNVIIGDSQTVYASANNMFIVSTDWGGGWYREHENYDTKIYRYSLGNDNIQFRSLGSVPGTLLNQFSLDENNGFLRVATKNMTYSSNSTSKQTKLLVLDARTEGTMNIVGRIDSIAPGEELYAARFAGNRGYLVTFKHIDPFFVIDLTDPKNPLLKGKLKIPGYSTYLQPYDENHVMGFGYDVDENNPYNTDDYIHYSALRGVKVAMFDVSDIANPKEVASDIIGDAGTRSQALYDHKAILFDRTKNLLAFPVTVYESDNQADICSAKTYSTCPTGCSKVCKPSVCTTTGGVTVCTADCDGAGSCFSSPIQSNSSKLVFDGLYVYQIDANGLKLRGKVTNYNENEIVGLDSPNYNKTIMRSLFIGNSLYTIATGNLKASDLTTLAAQNFITLLGDDQYVGISNGWPTM